MANILASVSVVVGAEITEFKAKMAAAKRELRGVVQAGEAMKDVGKTMTVAISAPLAALAVSAGVVGGNFEAAFNRVEAATQASGKELAELKKKAENIALDPKLKFSATEAAAAIENLSKNGASTADILNGAADASVNLATATGSTLATSADIATDVLQNFNRTAAELPGLVNSITGTTLASKLTIDAYKDALGQAGGVAGQLGVQFEDFNTALAITASGFSSGSDAGTSFKTFIQRLVPQSKEAAAAMEKLGLKFFDAQGKMKPLREIAGELQKAFKGLSDQQRTQLGTQIFGADSIRTALLLAKDGAEGFDKMAASIDKVNAAAQGGILNKGFVGAKEALKSAFEGFQIALSKSGILELGTKIAKMGAEILSSLAQLDPGILRAGVAFGALVAAVGPVLVAVGSLGVALPALTAGFSLLAGPVGIAVAAFGVLALSVAAVAASSRETAGSFKEQQTAFQALEKGINPLLTRYDELKAKTSLTKKEQEELRSIVQKVGEQIPTAITQFDAYGKAMDISSDAARRFVEQQRAILAIKNKKDLKEQREEYARLTGEINGAQNALKNFQNGKLVKPFFDESGGGFVPLTAEEITNLQAKLEELRFQRKGVGGLIDELKGIAPVVEKTKKEVDELNKTLVKTGGTGASDEMTKALDKIRDGLKQIDNEVKAGVNFDPIKDQIKILSGGIPDLLAAGFAPNSKVVSAFVNQLNGLETEYEKFAARIAAKQAEDGDIGKVRLDNPLKLDTTLPKALTVDTSYAEKAKEAAAAYQAAIASLQPAQLAAIQSQIEFNTGMEGLLEQMNSAVAPLLADVGLQFATAFGDIITGVSSAGDAFKGLFSSILQSIAGFMGTFGKQLIAIGIGKLGLDKLFASGPAGGPAAIAAGIGLVALAGVASSVAKSSAANLGKITGGGSLAPPAPRTLAPAAARPTALAPQGQAAMEKTLRMVLDISPAQFRAMVAYSTDRFGRVVGP
ncbi:phage tail tape measure protein [Hymenobacter sp. HD11105]